MVNRSKKIGKPKSSRARQRRLAQSQRCGLDFQTLEPRNLLAAIVVSSASDVVSPTADTSSIAGLIANDGGDGISLREAIAAADNTTGEDTITFDESVFTGGDNSVIRLIQGELVINQSLNIDGTSVGGVLITGDADGDDVTVSGTQITDVLASFGGTAGAVDDLLDDNSRVLNSFGLNLDLTLTNLIITGGRTAGQDDGGGGIRYDDNAFGTLSLVNSTVSGNNANGAGAFGGGIYASSGDVTLTDSSVSGNSSGGGGGGINAISGIVSLSDSTVSGNSTTGEFADGGGINIGTGFVFVGGSTVSGNSSSGAGGGIFSLSGHVGLGSSTLSDNRTTGSYSDGGGIYTYSGTVSLRQSTVTSNSASGVGGGILLNGREISTSNFRGLSISNSIVAGNFESKTLGTAGTPNDVVLATDSFRRVFASYSIIGAADGLTIFGSPQINLLGTVAMPLDPLLGPLADNGGSTETHSLLPDSPAIDSGRNNSTRGLLIDQRGETRISNGTVDMGAFEFQVPPVAPQVISVVRDEGGVLARPDLLTTFAVTFDQGVHIRRSDLSVSNDSLGVALDISSVSFNYDAPTLTATWDFSSLPDLDASFYTFRLPDTINVIRSGLGLDGSARDGLMLDGDGDGVAGGDFTEEVYVAIPGDVNLDGDVEVNEINLFSGTNTGDGATVLSNLDRAGTFTWSEGDFNSDGDVDSSQLNLFTGEQNGDYAIFLANLGRSVRPDTSQLVTSQSSVSQPLISQPVSVVPVSLPVSAAVPANSGFTMPIDSLTSVASTSIAPSSVAPTSFVAEVVDHVAPVDLLLSAQATVDVQSQEDGRLTSDASKFATVSLPVNSAFRLQGAHELIDGFFAEENDGVEVGGFDDDIDGVDEALVDVLEEDWLAL
ncbi:hypothetical protein OAG71_01170 [bacterium]|nr:hypothetical protein [bacterium]